MGHLSALGLVCGLGNTKQDVAQALLAGDCRGMQPVEDWIPEQSVVCGVVTAELPEIPAHLQVHNTRNNRLLMHAVQQIYPQVKQAVERYGTDRIGVVLGTSTSGIYEAGLHISQWVREGYLSTQYDYRQQELGDPATFLSRWLELSGPSYSLSTACTSGARALMSAKRMLDAGVCDAVICGGADSLCQLTLNGFYSLEAISAERCNPFSAHRKGINIGEAAAVFLMTREAPEQPVPVLTGVGASSDAYHISAPQPEGLGAIQAMQKALVEAGLAPEDIDYINLHGTATQHNDAMESRAVNQLFGAEVACSSSKPMTGHTLGAAGALEAGFCWLALQSDYNPQHLLIPHLWDECADETLAPIMLSGRQSAMPDRPVRRMMSNSFAFGGNNTSLILEF